MDKEKINKVRGLTGAGLLQAKEALASTEWDVDRAVARLAAGGGTRPMKPAAYKAIFTYNHNHRIAATLILGCQTDFVGRLPEFLRLGNDLAQQVVGNPPENIESLLDQECLKNTAIKVREALAVLSASVRENVEILWFDRVEV